MMTYQDVMEIAKRDSGKCKACTVCNGIACGKTMPGPGAKGSGDGARRNYEQWQKIRVNMDTLHESFIPDTQRELFGKKFAYPFFAGPVGAVSMHYSDKFNDMSYNDVLVRACDKSGIAAFTGDGIDPNVMEAAVKAIEAVGGTGIPTIKPWDFNMIKQKVVMCRRSGCFAMAMDVDAAGLPFLKERVPSAGSKTEEELAEIVHAAGVPFIVKGIMTAKGALKAQRAGAAAVLVSNHGGRVQDQCPATAEVLPEIVEALRGSNMKILIDGGIRSGTDVFKALAMGADAAVIARPFVNAVYGGGREGVKIYIEKIGAELADTMSMCGAASLNNITRDMIRL